MLKSFEIPFSFGRTKRAEIYRKFFNLKCNDPSILLSYEIFEVRAFTVDCVAPFSMRFIASQLFHFILTGNLLVFLLLRPRLVGQANQSSRAYMRRILRYSDCFGSHFFASCGQLHSQLQYSSYG